VSPSNTAPLVLLASLNGILVATLSSFTSDPIAMRMLQQSTGSFASVVAAVVPALIVYASLYALGPAFRYFQNKFRNLKVQKSNAIRARAAQVRFCGVKLLWCRVTKGMLECSVLADMGSGYQCTETVYCYLTAF
jgi:hypothetical protein